ncbi:hypothetical protein L083_0192 [Actinoplanes sp. N902-109]|nr:hypothetical protein L083_0192 [Actinoplanes sp. N902-109]
MIKHGPSMTISSPDAEPLIADWMVAASDVVFVQFALTFAADAGCAPLKVTTAEAATATAAVTTAK